MHLARAIVPALLLPLTAVVASYWAEGAGTASPESSALATPTSTPTPTATRMLTATPTRTPGPTPTPTPPPFGQFINCPQAGKWSMAVYNGLGAAPADVVATTCNDVPIEAVYWLDPDTQAWQRLFPGHADLGTLTTLTNLQGVLALGSRLPAASAAGSLVAPQGQWTGELVGCPQPGKWAISVWNGPLGEPADQAFATCPDVTVTAAYRIDPEKQTWERYLADRPDISDLGTLDAYDGVLTFGASQPADLGEPTRYSRGIYSIGLDGGGPALLIDRAGAVLGTAAWNPLYQTYSATPDASAIAFVAGQQVSLGHAELHLLASSSGETGRSTCWRSRSGRYVSTAPRCQRRTTSRSWSLQPRPLLDDGCSDIRRGCRRSRENALRALSSSPTAARRPSQLGAISDHKRLDLLAPRRGRRAVAPKPPPPCASRRPPRPPAAGGKWS